MLIGYSVLYINEDMTIKDVLWEKRIVYSSWEESLKKAKEKAEEEIKNWGEKTYMVALSKSESKKMCESNGNTCVFKINHKSIGNIGEIYIVPVYNE
jgi:hypothetical protein